MVCYYWAYININPGATVGDEINVIKAMPTFFENGSTIERVYYFSAKDDQGGGRGIPENINVLSKAPQELWKAFADTCAQIDSQYPLNNR